MPDDFPAAWLALTDAQRDAYGATMGEVDAMVEERMEQSRYSEFIERRSVLTSAVGFIPEMELNPMMFPFQADCTRWSLRKGRSALFQDCGLGKTFEELEWGRHVSAHEGKPVLIFAPLAVAMQTKREGEKFGIDVTVCRTGKDVRAGVNVTNYEMLEHFTPEVFSGLVLDESSCLKGHDRATRKLLTEFASGLPYRLSCSATPAPNDFMELGTQAEFLGIMPRTEMLSMFFIHDGSDTAKWRLKGHGAAKFWEWLSSWAVVMRKPSDLGYEDNGFNLPPLSYHQHVVDAEWKSDYLFPVEAKTMDERRRARRDSIAGRVNLCADLVNSSPDNQWLVWCDLNDESAALTKQITGAVEVKGADSISHKETAMQSFADGGVRVLVSKPSIAGWGMNFQNCSKMAFVGLSDSWEQLYQATRRCWRFGQTRPVDVHIFTSELEGSVVRNIERKEKQADEMATEMLVRMKDFNSKEVHGSRRETSEYKRRTERGNGWELRLGDCIDVAREIESESVGFQIFSPPFASLYTYSNSDRDMGNAKSYAEFFEHYRFLAEEQFRICASGRVLAFHCMNIPLMKERDGVIGLRDFRGDLIRAYEPQGFIFDGEVCIWKDPLIEATRTKAIGLAHKQIVKDSALCRIGLPDYIIKMRKPGENPTPISHGPSGFKSYIGTQPEPKAAWNDNHSLNKYSHEVWQRYASPVWFDVDQSDTLQRETARENDDERHICPLQLPVIERCMELWSAPGDLVFSPFAGIGSEGYVALKMGRRFLGSELKESYFDLAVRNLRSIETAMQDGFNFSD